MEVPDVDGAESALARPLVLKILGSEMPRSTAVLCTDSLVARPRGTKIRREVVFIRVLNSLGGNKDY